MLECLKINNFVLIPTINLDFYDGMTVLTGETGSGKSIVLGAISLILGSKADKDEIRAGESKAELEAVFRTERKSLIALLDEKGIDSDDGRIIIRRQIRSNGRSFYSLNGANLTIAEAQEIGRMLVDITGQNSALSLVRKDRQLSLLDSSKEIAASLSSYEVSYEEYLSLVEERKACLERMRKVEEDRSYLEYCLDELDKAELREGEDDEIKAKLEVASSSEYIVENLQIVKEGLDNASRSLSAALSALFKAKGKDESLDEYYQRMESSGIETDDLLQSISAQLSSYSFDPYELEDMNSRLATLQRIRKKYGGSIEAAIAKRDEIRLMLDEAEGEAISLDRLDKAIEKKRAECLEKAESLHMLRHKRAEKLGRDITATLKKLSMESAEFRIELEKTSLGAKGFDDVSFLIAPNKGERMSPVEDAASGGELSRIMLAIKSNFLDSDDVETLIFDEIDSGISGHAATNVASVMKELSKRHQIIAITHLAQIASKADNHILVHKSEEKGRTVSHLDYIEGEKKVAEIARLLSGDDSDISLRHARSLIEV